MAEHDFTLSAGQDGTVFAQRCREAASPMLLNDMLASLPDAHCANRPQTQAGDRVAHCYLGSRRVTPDGLDSLLRFPDIDLNACNDVGQTPLHVACEAGLRAAIPQILSAGAGANGGRPDLPSPLSMAMDAGWPEAVVALLSLGADIDDVRAAKACFSTPDRHPEAVKSFLYNARWLRPGTFKACVNTSLENGARDLAVKLTEWVDDAPGPGAESAGPGSPVH